MSTPHVTAAAALVAAQHPDWTPADTKQHLRDTARRVSDMGSARWTEAYGSGLLDVATAAAA